MPSSLSNGYYTKNGRGFLCRDRFRLDWKSGSLYQA